MTTALTTATKISTLWIVLVLNMMFADILSFMYPGFLAEVVATGRAEGVLITPVFLLVAAVFIEVAIAMVFVSRVARVKTARIANFFAVGITAMFILGGASLTPHYVFFATVEVVTLIYIARLAWGWRETADAAWEPARPETTV